MNSNDYDFEDEAFEDDGRQQLEEYEQYVRELRAKARALLAHPVGHIVGHIVAKELACIVRKHADPDGNIALADMLRDSMWEHVVTWALMSREEILKRRVGREGFAALQESLDGAWQLFAALSDEASK
jgi:hypothetical protein